MYVPDTDENNEHINWSDKRMLSQKIYIMKSSTVSTCYFLPIIVSSLIEKGEFESLGKSEKTLDGSQVIKANCIKLMIDRLGNIKPYRTTQQNQNLLQKEMDQSNIASEPAVLYQPKLTFYADHAEQNETEAKYNASLTMQERLKQTLGLIRSIFGDRSVSPDFPGTFTIKKLDI